MWIYLNKFFKIIINYFWYVHCDDMNSMIFTYLKDYQFSLLFEYSNIKYRVSKNNL